MSRKLMVLGLAVVLAISAAIPVVAQDRVVAPKVQKISKRALKTARSALRQARSAAEQAATAAAGARNAEAAAGSAKATAAGAVATAGEARGRADEARARADEARTGAEQARAAAEEAGTAAGETRAMVEAQEVSSASATAAVTTSSQDFVALAGGPSVTVEVPASGLIEVWAQAAIEGEGAVSLFEGDTPVAGQAELCSPEEGVGALFAVQAALGEPLTISTPAAGAPGLCGTLGAPGPVLFQTTPGTHTYELRYASCGCEDPAEAVAFSDRRLHVAPRP